MTELARSRSAAPAGGPAPSPTTQGRPQEDASLWMDTWRSLRKNPWFLVSAVLLLVLITVALFPQLFATHDPRECFLGRSRQEPSAEHWFGTDIQGCDYYTRVIYGAANSMAVGVIVTGSILVLGSLLGLMAAYFGGWVDAVLMRLTDLIFAIPYMLGALVFLAVQENRNVWDVAFILIVFTWPTMARLMRGSVLAVINNDYVTAARALGAGPLTIMRRHIIPNSLGPVVGYAAVYTGVIIGAEATLTFLGVGLQLPAISWGLQLNDAQSYLQQMPHLLTFPLIFVALTVFAFTTMGEALRDALDPKSKKR
ncbi:ABC transporter permease [Nesterenkonia natronophila]|uniref:ABC transporter permease n=1 Tax=Nesterenkonia natronophila TaxID=2174932 RepID=A0A3A4F5W5_9MICC|nr:ABC transporter permease [Nesterenkonia natronophila]RJN31850.1 ABC transporter permease [Nesterenkonia natronophila]